MFSGGFGGFGTPGTTNNVVIGSTVDADSGLASAVDALQERVGDLEEDKADQTALDSLSTIGDGGIVNHTYWVTSPEYNLSTHPDTPLAVRWVHKQGTEPVSVQMFVRAFDPNNPANSLVYPYSNWRVQMRIVRAPTSSASLLVPTLFVRLAIPDGTACRIHRMQIVTLDGEVTGTITSNLMVGAENVLSATGSAVPTGEAG
jgi:hypothetical protein